LNGIIDSKEAKCCHLSHSALTSLDIGGVEGYFAESVKNPRCETWAIEPLASTAQRLPRGLIALMSGCKGSTSLNFGRAKYVLARAKSSLFALVARLSKLV
jgi:hypothetical protein